MISNEIDILFLCDLHPQRPWIRDRIEGINKAIETEDINIVLLDIYKACGEEGLRLREANHRDRNLCRSNIVKLNNDLYEKIIELNPKSIILATADNYIDFLLLETVEKIKDLGIYLIGFLGDDEFNYPQYKYLSCWFDMFVVYVKSYVDFYKTFSENEGYWLPNSCHLKETNKGINQEKVVDTVFIGAPIADRVDLLLAMSKAGLSIEIYGSNRWKYIKGLNSNYKGYVASNEFDKVLSRSTIVLCPLKDHINGNLHMNTKIWEACRVKRLPIISYYKPLIEDYGFKEDYDIVFFRTSSELINKIKYYKSNPIIAQEILSNMIDKINTHLDYSLLYAKLFKLISHNIDESEKRKPPKNKKFKSKDTIQIYNYKASKLILKDKDYIYSDYVYKGKRINQYWPFINLKNMIVISSSNSLKSKIMNLLFKKGEHIRSLNYIETRKTKTALINKTIHSSLIALRRQYKLLILPLLIKINLKR